MFFNVLSTYKSYQVQVHSHTTSPPRRSSNEFLALRAATRRRCMILFYVRLIKACVTTLFHCDRKQLLFADLVNEAI